MKRGGVGRPMRLENCAVSCRFFSHFGSIVLTRTGVRTTIPDRGMSLNWNLGVGLVALGQLRMNVLITSAMTWKKRGNAFYPPNGCVFTASRGTFAFAAESPGLFHSPPSFFTSLSFRIKEPTVSVKKESQQREREREREEHGT